MQVRSFGRLLAVISVLGIVAAACSSNPSTTPSSGGPSASASGTATQGGQATFGAEQWPQCLNIITDCAFSTWMQIVGPQPTLPKLVTLDEKGNYVASPVITEVPSLDNGGVTESPFSVTFHIDPKAVWDDGSPITSADVDFTWKAIMNTTGSLGKAGYDQIDSVDTSDPQTAKVTFKDPYADWLDLFGGGSTNGFVIKKAAFPDADPDKPDLKDEMTDMIPFSGGPWKMQSFSKSQEVLVRNDNYWGHKANLDQVTFIPLQEQPQEIASLLSGEVSVIFPQASNVSVTDQFKANPNVQSVSGPTNYDDAYWFNMHGAPDKASDAQLAGEGDPLFADAAVRQAFAYGVDRQAVVDTVIKINDPQAEILNCIPNVFPTVGTWCDQSIQGAFGQYNYDPAKSIQLLEGAGWDCSGVPDNPCTKGGKPLQVDDYITAGNERRKAVGQLVAEKIRPAGFDMRVKENDATDLFTNKLPQGAYELAEYAGGAVVDPSPVSSYACDQIPTKDNGFAGGNTSRYCKTDLDPVMRESDKALDPAARAQQISQIYTQLGNDLVALPLYPFINITGWRADKIAGPVGAWNQAPFGTYMNMDEWYIAS
jgi:peptide/nickel transport system substrate-binding protein